MVNILIDEVVWPHQPLGRDTGGTPDSVKAITRDDVIRYMEQLYVPQNTVVAVAGNVTAEEVLDRVGAYLGDWQPRQGRGDTATVLPVRWGVDVSQFHWNAGTLGGGDLTVRAGRDVSNITAAAADSGYGLPGGQIAHQQGGVLSLPRAVISPAHSCT
jgi:hypothetical protein